MKDIYNDRTYLTRNPTWNAEDAPFKAAEILKLLVNLNMGTICEIGCGSGEILVQLSQRLPEDVRFFGFDVSRDAMEIAKLKETPSIRFDLRDLSAPADDLPLFDLLLVIDVIEHVDNYFAFLDGIRPKGRYTVFHIPLDLSVWSLFRESILIESKARVGHIHNFTEDFILSVLADHGFRVVDKSYTPPTFETMGFKQRVVNACRKTLFKINKRLCMKLIGGYSVMVLCEN